MITQKIGFIGAGNMAQAIALGLIDAGAIDASNLTVSAPSLKNLERFKNVGANITHDNNEVITNSDIVFLAMKPQYLDSALNTIVNIPYEGKVYISILAGVKLETFEKKFKEKWSLYNTSNNTCRHKIIRVLPNTAVLVGAGCSVMAPNTNTTEEEVSLVKSILSVGGSCEVIPENLINSCSAVCGSGPAFVSCDKNFNLESNSNNKSIPFKFASTYSTAIKIEESITSKVSSEYPSVEKLCLQAIPDTYYKAKNNISSSESGDSEGKTDDASDEESISEKFSVKIESKTANDTTKIYEDNVPKAHFSPEVVKQDSDIDNRSSSIHSFEHQPANDYQSLKPDNENAIKNKCFIVGNCSWRQRRPYRQRCLRVTNDHIDYAWNWNRNWDRSCYPYPNYNQRRSRFVPYDTNNYLFGRLPNDQVYSSPVNYYSGYYRNHDSNEDDGRYDDSYQWNIRYRNDEPVNEESTFSNQGATYFELRNTTDIDCIFSQPIVRRCRQNPPVHPLQVVIIRFCQDSISPYMAAKIRRTLILRVNCTFGSGFSPKFEATYLLCNGHFLVSCSDEATVKWLLKQKLTETNGSPFVIMKLNNLPLMQVVDTFIPYNKGPVVHILECLENQNPGLRTEKWLLAKRSVRRSGQYLRLSIDKESCELLDLLRWKPYFQLYRLPLNKVDIHEETICILCKSFSESCSLSFPE